MIRGAVGVWDARHRQNVAGSILTITQKIRDLSNPKHPFLYFCRGLEELRAGTDILRTSHTDWDIDQIVKTYWRLTEIEADFCSLKSELGLRPIYHHKTRRIAGHLLIAILALWRDAAAVATARSSDQ